MTEELQPQQAEDYVLIKYWKCNVIGHRHQSPKAAATCIMKRKGEAGELKKLRRNLAMIEGLRLGLPLVTISKQNYCSDANVTKAASSSLKKAWKFANANGGIKYPYRVWSRADFTDPALRSEIEYLTNILKEMEVKLDGLL